MAGMRVTTAEPMTEARERFNIVSFLEEVRGEVEPSKQKILDTLSAVYIHEHNGVQLYQQYSQQAKSEEIKQTWQSFGEQTRVHEQVAERCINALGGDPQYMSPVAKDVDKIDKTMLKVEASGVEGDLVRGRPGPPRQRPGHGQDSARRGAHRRARRGHARQVELDHVRPPARQSHDRLVGAR